MTTWHPITAETESETHDSTAAELNVSELTICNLPEGVLAKIPQIEHVNCYPSHIAKRHDRRTRQTVLVLAINIKTKHVPVVQPAKAGSDEWALIQGGIDRNETAFAAVHREAQEEASIRLQDIEYIHSYRAPIDEASEKKEYFDYQLFHCFVALTSDAAVIPKCQGVAYATMWYQDEVLSCLMRSASEVKRALLPPLFQAAVERELLPPSACR